MYKTLTIAYTTCYLDVSGVTKLNFDILNRLKSKEFKIHVITTEENKSKVSNSWDYLFDIYINKPFQLSRMNKKKRLNCFLKYLIDNKITIVFNTHSLWLYENLSCIKKNLPYIKLIDSLHVLEPYCFRGGYPDISANKYVHPYIDRSILISEDLKNYLLKNYEVNADKLTVIRNGIDATKFSWKDNLQGKFKCEIGLEDKSKLVGFIGRLVDQKRPLMFLEIVKQIALSDNSCFFYMIGTGNLEKNVIKFIKKNNLSNRIFLFKERNDIDCILNSTNLLLVPSLYEGAPLTILEAISAKVHIIASDVGAIKEYVGNFCSLIPRSDKNREINMFIEQSLKLLRNPIKLEYDAKYVREYDINRTSEEYGNIFFKAIEHAEFAQ